MELSTTTRGKAKLLWNGYTKHTEKNDTIRWRCTCRASKHCPASAFTDLLPAYPVLKTDYNHCPEPVKLEVDSSRTEMRICAGASNDLPSCIYADNITALTGAAKAILPSVDMCKFFLKKYAFIEYLLVLPKCHATKMYVTKMSYYQNVCYQNVLLPKRSITEMLPKCHVTKMSCYRNVSYQNVHYQSVLYQNVWIPY